MTSDNSGHLRLWFLIRFWYSILDNSGQLRPILDDSGWLRTTLILYDSGWLWMTSEDSRWFRMTPDDFRWLQMTSDDFRRLRMTSTPDDSWRFWKAPDDSKRLQIMLGGPTFRSGVNFRLLSTLPITTPTTKGVIAPVNGWMRLVHNFNPASVCVRVSWFLLSYPRSKAYTPGGHKLLCCLPVFLIEVFVCDSSLSVEVSSISE